MIRPRIRQRILTFRPQIVCSGLGGFWVERRNREGDIQCRLTYSFREAVTIANEWAHEVPREATV